jgi:prepilin-type N-terminal cleavage/methylation domain-containing protein
MRTLSARDQRGFTLTELLVTLAILGLIMTAVVTVQISGNRIFFTGENQAEAQQAARAAMLMEDDLRLIGTGCPVPGCFGGAAPCNQAQASPSSVCQATATGMVFWADLANASTNTTQIANAGQTVLNVLNAAGFAVGDQVFIINGNDFETKTVGAVNAGGNTITLTAGLGAAPAPVPAVPSYPIGTIVGRPQIVTYSLAGTTLSRNTGAGLQPIATGISNLTFTYFDASEAGLAPLPLAAGSLPLVRRIQVVTRTQSAAAQNPGSFGITTNVRPRALP